MQRSFLMFFKFNLHQLLLRNWPTATTTTLVANNGINGSAALLSYSTHCCPLLRRVTGG